MQDTGAFETQYTRARAKTHLKSECRLIATLDDQNFLLFSIQYSVFNKIICNKRTKHKIAQQVNNS